MTLICHILIKKPVSPDIYQLLPHKAKQIIIPLVTVPFEYFFSASVWGRITVNWRNIE